MRIGISIRQVKRLVHRYRNKGSVGLINEKLREIHGLCLSTETLRKWMVE
ncbi:hypothetical protein [Leclercia tamurae]